MININCATRLTEAEFWNHGALGLSLRRLVHDDRLRACIVYENGRGLPAIYNERIAAADAGQVQVFVHDDVWLDDHFFGEHLLAGVQEFDVIGVAGNRRRAPNQPSWAFQLHDSKLEWDDRANLSGAVSHGKSPFGIISSFGAVPASCELMDGVLLAARTQVLREHQLLFDERFQFHFYDMDFCRSARVKNLRLGTWPIAITHQSKGGFGTNGWIESYKTYLQKWGD